MYMLICSLSCPIDPHRTLHECICTRWLRFRWLSFFYRYIFYILVTCRLSFSYLCIPYMYNMLPCWLSCSYWCTRNMRTRWLSFPIDASRMYMLKRWLYYIYNFFSNTHRLILISAYHMHAKRNVLVMIRRIGGVSSCLCCANDIVVTEEPDDIRI